MYSMFCVFIGKLQGYHVFNVLCVYRKLQGYHVFNVLCVYRKLQGYHVFNVLCVYRKASRLPCVQRFVCL